MGAMRDDTPRTGPSCDAGSVLLTSKIFGEEDALSASTSARFRFLDVAIADICFIWGDGEIGKSRSSKTGAEWKSGMVIHSVLLALIPLQETTLLAGRPYQVYIIDPRRT